MTKINLPRTARQFEFSDKHFCRALIPEFAPAENSASARHADPNERQCRLLARADPVLV